jgi:N-acetyl-gamma-glutamyl-phosphate reductase
MDKLKVGIIGAAGYTAGELIRILLRHPQAEIIFAQSASHAGQPICQVHSDLTGETELQFTAEADLDTSEVIFLCQGHGKSAAFMGSNRIPSGVKVIDLSTDFRLQDGTHDFVYGLPELQRDKIRNACHLANPGCFATGIQLALLPLAASGLLQSAVHVHAITGSTGAGQQPTETTHFSWREGNVSAYKVFTHQHEGEILQSLRFLQPGFNQEFNFVPIRGNFTRGIFVTAYTHFDGSPAEARNLFDEYYKGHPFSIVTSANPHLKQVVNTNKALIYLEKHDSRLLIITCTDNLLKGASGQAVQNMNLMFGLDETEGLMLKPVAF